MDWTPTILKKNARTKVKLNSNVELESFAYIDFIVLPICLLLLFSPSSETRYVSWQLSLELRKENVNQGIR